MRKLIIFCITFMFVLAFSFQEQQPTQASSSKLGPNLQTLIQQEDGPYEVIITFDSMSQSAKMELLKETGLSKAMVLKELPFAGAVVSQNQLNELSKLEQVHSIYDNESLQYENAEATAYTGVDQVRTDPSLQELNNGLPITGKGVGVVINDSGVDGTHADLEYGPHLVQNVLGATNLNALSDVLPVTYVENVPATDNDSGHGTHVAGIVGATGEKSGGKHEGVAPGASLIGYGSGAGIAILDTLTAFEYALVNQEKYNIRVITNSWGSTSDVGTPFDPNHPVNIATKELYDHGIVTVFSAGNSGPDEGTISGNYKKAPWVITVAAGTKDGQLTDFSSRGQKQSGGTVVVDGETWVWKDQPTVTAPGSKIISTRVLSPLPLLATTDDLTLIEPAYVPYYTTMSGTSMAAPHVAGIVALMLEADPTLSPSEVKSIIEQTATPMDEYEAIEVGAGYVNAYKAVIEASK